MHDVITVVHCSFTSIHASSNRMRAHSTWFKYKITVSSLVDYSSFGGLMRDLITVVHCSFTSVRASGNCIFIHSARVQI